MEKTLAQQIGMRLKLLRIERELNQTKLAEILQVTKSNISKYEKGDVEINFETLHKISEYFDVSLDYLFGFTEVRKEDDLKIDYGYFTVSQEAYEKGITPEQLKAAMDFYMSVVKDVKSKEKKTDK
jgi:transcriptional regulator with XRE-family HTH domain